MVSTSPVDSAYAARAEATQVRGTGVVARLLADDTDGSPHQRFVLALPSGLTVLVTHNLDLSSRLDGLALGDEVEFYGEYVWSEQGGTVHWTHDDPHRAHVTGWLKWKGRTYS